MIARDSCHYAADIVRCFTLNVLCREHPPLYVQYNWCYTAETSQNQFHLIICQQSNPEFGETLYTMRKISRW